MTIAEPVVDVSKINNLVTQAGDAGDPHVYDITISNTASGDDGIAAFDLTLSDTLDAYLNLQSIAVDDSGVSGTCGSTTQSFTTSVTTGFGGSFDTLIDEIRVFGSKDDSNGALTLAQLNEIWALDQVQQPETSQVVFHVPRGGKAMFKYVFKSACTFNGTMKIGQINKQGGGALSCEVDIYKAEPVHIEANGNGSGNSSGSVPSNQMKYLVREAPFDRPQALVKIKENEPIEFEANANNVIVVDIQIPSSATAGLTMNWRTLSSITGGGG